MTHFLSRRYAVALFAGIVATPAHADENWYLVRATCVPELRVFQVGRLHTTNIPHGAEVLDDKGAPRPEVGERMARVNGVYEWATLEHHPIACHVAGHRQDDRSTNRWPAFDVAARIDAKSGFVLVEVNGSRVGDIALDEAHGWKETSEITVWDDGVGLAIRTCSDGNGSDSEMFCKMSTVTDRN